VALIPADGLDSDALAYRIFGVTRDREPWRIADILRGRPRTDDPDRAHLAWQIASRGFYAEQAGLTAAATLAAFTEDAPLRFSLALAAADEARHADAFYQYAKAAGGEPEECADELEPLDSALVALPHMGRALVHTMLEGVAADEFILLRDLFSDDPLGDLYRYVRRDEIRHVSIGLNYLTRASATPIGREIWDASADEWHAIGAELIALAPTCEWLASLTHRDPAALHLWFLRRHRVRLRAAGIQLREGGESL
jgi:hypothetical protein